MKLRHDSVPTGVQTSLEQSKINVLKLRNVSEQSELRLHNNVFRSKKLRFKPFFVNCKMKMAF